MTNKDRAAAISQADFDTAKTGQTAANATVTARLSGRKRRPWHTGQGVADMNCIR